MTSLFYLALGLFGFGLFGVGFELLARYREHRRDRAHAERLRFERHLDRRLEEVEHMQKLKRRSMTYGKS